MRSLDERFDEAFKIVKYGLTPVVWDIELARALESEVDSDKFLDIHIKIDTGMGRMGLLPSEFSELFDEIEKYSHFKIGKKVHKQSIEQAS